MGVCSSKDNEFFEDSVYNVEASRQNDDTPRRNDDAPRRKRANSYREESLFSSDDECMDEENDLNSIRGSQSNVENNTRVCSLNVSRSASAETLILCPNPTCAFDGCCNNPNCCKNDNFSILTFMQNASKSPSPDTSLIKIPSVQNESSTMVIPRAIRKSQIVFSPPAVLTEYCSSIPTATQTPTSISPSSSPLPSTFGKNSISAPVSSSSSSSSTSSQ